MTERRVIDREMCGWGKCEAKDGMWCVTYGGAEKSRGRTKDKRNIKVNDRGQSVVRGRGMEDMCMCVYKRRRDWCSREGLGIGQARGKLTLRASSLLKVLPQPEHVLFVDLD